MNLTQARPLQMRMTAQTGKPMSFRDGKVLEKQRIQHFLLGSFVLGSGGTPSLQLYSPV